MSNKIKCYLKLMRIKHYIKNLLIFIPLFFSGKLLDYNLLLRCSISFCVFNFLASSIYIINDLKDIEQDKLHKKKCMRPIASGKVSKNEAIIVAIICIFLSYLFNYLLCDVDRIRLFVVITLYFVMNIGYSLKFKNIPIADISILAISYFLRVYYGSLVTNIVISDWLYLAIISGAFFLGLGKRRNELKQMDKTQETRMVLKYYTESYLNNNMYVFLTLGIVFYSLWSMTTNLLITVPILIIICLKYTLIIEGESDGDPVDTILSDKMFILLLCLLVIILAWKIYFC